jgi:outer membrane murein-binding lipoprotein Lpp
MAEDLKTWLALGTSALAFAGGIYAATTSRSSQQEVARLNAKLQMERDQALARREAQTTLSKFRDPLMHASYDLQSRIFNILERGFLDRYYLRGSDREKGYALENTVFLVAQFLGWTEAIREEIQFVDLDGNEQTRQLRYLQDAIYTQMQTDRIDSGFRLFAGEQRAIGELMIKRDGGVCRSIGFAAFTSSRDPAIDQWLNSVRDDIKATSSDIARSKERLTMMQHSLVDLLDFLDPECIRFPRDNRRKVSPDAAGKRAPGFRS